MTDHSQDPVIKAYMEAKRRRDQGIPVASAEVFDWLQADDADGPPPISAQKVIEISEDLEDLTRPFEPVKRSSRWKRLLRRTR